MKKIISLTALFSIFTLGSCFKERVCTCVDEQGYQVEMEIPSAHRSTTEKACEDFENLGYTKCKLE